METGLSVWLATRLKAVMIPMDVSGCTHGFQEHPDVRLVDGGHDALQFGCTDSLANDGENVSLRRQG